MKIRFLIVLAAALAASIPGFCNEQGEGRKEGAFKHPLLSEEFPSKLKERLKLSADQEAKVQAALQKSRPELEKAQAEVQAAHERMKKTVAGVLETIRATLDLDQKEKFDEMSRHLKGGGPGKRRRGGPDMKAGDRPEGGEGPRKDGERGE